MEPFDDKTVAKILNVQNECLLSMLHMISMLPAEVKASDVKRLGDELRRSSDVLEKTGLLTRNG